MKELLKWASDHPIKSNLISMLSICAGVIWSHDLRYGVAAFALLIIFAITTIWLDSQKWLRALLSAAFLIPQSSKASENPEVVPIGICVVVIVVGGVAGCQLNKFCKKHFAPPSTNSPPLGEFQAAGDDSYAASSCAHYKVTGCESGSNLTRLFPEEGSENHITIIGHLKQGESGPEIQRLSLATCPKNALIDFAEYQRRLQTLGLTVCNTGGCSSYAHNGVPIDPSTSPVSFSFGPENVPSITISGDGASVNVVVERSNDLENWEAISYITAPIGKTLVVGDDPDSQSAFYRMRVLL